MNHCDFNFLVDQNKGLEVYLQDCDYLYKVVNFHKLYFVFFEQNKLFFGIFLTIIIFFLLLNIRIVAEQYLSRVNLSLIKKFKIPMLISSVTLIAFTNGILDIMDAAEEQSQKFDNQLSASTLFGSFITSTTLVFGNVLYQMKQNDFEITKQIRFNIVVYTILVGTILIDSCFGKTKMFSVIYVIIYLIYLWNLIKNFSKQKKVIFLEDEEKIILKSEQKVKKTKKITQKYNIFLILHWLTIPYYTKPQDNQVPSFIFLYHDFFNFPFAAFLSFKILFNFTNFLSLICTILVVNAKLYCERHRLKKPSIILQRSLTILASLSWLKLTSKIVLDIIIFLSYSLKINPAVLAGTFISLANSSLDFFANGSLSKMGKHKLAALSCFSGPVFNLAIGIFLNQILSKKEKFQIFAQNKSFIIWQIFMICLTLAFAMNLQHINKKNYIFLFVFYVLYIVGSFTINNQLILELKIQKKRIQKQTLNIYIIKIN